jgi:hypothetical protein
VGALGVECIGGDHCLGQVDTGAGEPVEQRGEHGDFVGLRAHFDLAQDQGVGVGRGREQVYLVAFDIGGAAHGLAVHRDRDQRRCVGIGLACGGLSGQPGADHRVHGRGISAGDHPPDGGLGRCLGAPAVELGQQLGGDIGGPAGDRGERTHARHDCGRAQREHHRDRVDPPLVAATIRDLGELLQQFRAHHRRRRKVVSSGRTRSHRIERGEARIGDGRMKQQRSSGGEKFVRGLLVLPELRRPSRHDTPKITNPVCQRTFPSTSSLPEHTCRS